jgi:hypothetical protein
MNLNKLKNENELSDAISLKLKTIYGENAKRYTHLIDTVKKLKGADSLFKEALNFNDIRMPDFMVELLFASFFFEEDYTVEIIPRSDLEKTPDLLVSKTAFRGFVEIKHIHKKHDGPRVVLPNESPELEILEQYGDSIRDERYCRDKILEGFQQIQQFSGLVDTDVMIVAIWNSDEDIEEINMKFSISNLIKEKDEFENMPNPKWIVYGSHWYSLRENTKFHVFRF